MLCPASFGATNRRANNWPYKPPSAVPPQPESLQDVVFTLGRFPPEVQLLIDVYPTINTLFHELFHLVNGMLMPNRGPETYSIAEMINPAFGFDRASNNPQSYVAVATAYDYTRTFPPDRNGNYVEFWPGFALRG